MTGPALGDNANRVVSCDILSMCITRHSSVRGDKIGVAEQNVVSPMLLHTFPVAFSIVT